MEKYNAYLELMKKWLPDTQKEAEGDKNIGYTATRIISEIAALLTAIKQNEPESKVKDICADISNNLFLISDKYEPKKEATGG